MVQDAGRGADDEVDVEGVRVDKVVCEVENGAFAKKGEIKMW